MQGSRVMSDFIIWSRDYVPLKIVVIKIHRNNNCIQFYVKLSQMFP